MKQWVVTNAAGESAAMLLSALLGALFSRIPAEGNGLVVLPVLMVLTGMLEGALIGAAQAVVLDVPRGKWTLLTSGAFGAAWALGALTSVVEPEAAPSTATVLVYAGCAGLILGALVGIAQGRIAKEPSHVARTSLGWGCSLMIVAISADFVPEGPLGVSTVAINGVAGALAGALVGLVTWDSVAPLGLRARK